MESGSDDISNNYDLKEKDKEDPDTKEWCKLIDLDTVIETKLDWRSTRTFELFLDALDVNQFVIKDDKKSNPKTDIGQTNSKASPTDEGTKDKIVTNGGATAAAGTAIHNGSEQKIPKSGAIKCRVDTYQGVETILSAEALKILSDLPDLSHMSSTRSFIFPKYNTVRK